MTRDAYTYASAKIRALEKHLMSDSDLTRVIDAKDADVAFKAFNSLDYAGELLDLEARDYRTAMARKMSRLKKVLEKVVPDETLIRLLFVERDYHNIKVILKERASGETFEEHVEEAPGLVNVHQLRRYIIEELPSDVDESIKKDIDELKIAIGDDKDPERIENLVDQKLNSQNQRLAKKLKNKFITTLYKYLADKNNVSIFMRAKRAGKSKAWFEERVSDAGFISVHIYAKYYDSAEMDEFVQTLKSYFPSVMGIAVEEYMKDKRMSAIELGMNNVIMEHLRSAKLIGFGPEVIVAYYFAKKYAIKNLSTIMALKFSNIDPAEIRNHLVNNYVLL